MHDFIAHHKLPKDLPLPEGSMMIHKALSCVMDLMAHSLGEEKRNQLLTELEEYKKGLPFDLR